MKKVIIAGDSSSIGSVSAYFENYLGQASVPVLVNEKPGHITFEWDDTKAAGDGTPLEHLFPRPIDRIMDTVHDIICMSPSEYDDFRTMLSNMRPNSALFYDYDLGAFHPAMELVDTEDDWIMLKSGMTSVDALHYIRNNKTTNGNKLAARLGTKVITLDKIEDSTLTSGELLSEEWEVIEIFGKSKKEIEERIRTNEIRNLLKQTNYLGIKHTEIDEMDIDDIWHKLCEHSFSNDRKYEMLKKILDC